MGRFQIVTAKSNYELLSKLNEFNKDTKGKYVLKSVTVLKGGLSGDDYSAWLEIE